MISPLTCDDKKMVKLILVTDANKEFTKSSLEFIIDKLEKSGFSVVCVTCNNAAVNRSIIKEYTNYGKNYFIFSKNHTNLKIFFLFDASHIIKTLRSCWINSQF